MADAGAGRRGAAIVRWRRLYDQLPRQGKRRADLKAAIERLETAE
jgi:cytochrome c-type biogenesis protein CcmH/NrfG